MCHFLTPFRAFENTVKDFIRRHFVHFRSAEPLRKAFYPFFPHTAHRISTVSPASRMHAMSCAATAFFSAKVRAANSISRVSSPRLCARSLSCCRVCRCRWIFPELAQIVGRHGFALCKCICQPLRLPVQLRHRRGIPAFADSARGFGQSASSLLISPCTRPSSSARSTRMAERQWARL